MTPISLFGYHGNAFRAKQKRLMTIAAELSASPSTPAVFRDVTLVASIRGYEVVAVAPASMLGSYNCWMWRYGLWDYVSDLVAEDQIRPDEVGLEIVGGEGAQLNAHNLGDVLRHIPILT